MAGLRVFVSSTMRDLRNEREEVVTRLRASNYEPVNAEGFSPTGEGSWDRIVREIRTSDLFVLVLGETYGWIPPDGPFGGAGKSVTELEYDAARTAGLPILAFLKQLGYGVDATSDDARKRDAFRRRVEDWAGGAFRSEFDLARDLADSVGRAITTVLTNSFKDVVAERRRTPEVRASREAVPNDSWAAIELPTGLARAVAGGEVVALLGAGVSVSAGMPSAVAFADRIIQRIRDIEPGYQAPSTGAQLNAVAADLESLTDRKELERTVEQMMRPTFDLVPTAAHVAAARLFPQLITTNFDGLLEQALRGLGIERPIVAAETSSELPNEVVVKLHGAVDQPGTLVLTDHDLVGLPARRPRLWGQLVELLRGAPLLAVGSSLRDPSVVELFDEVGSDLRGWAVMYQTARSDRLRLRQWALEPIDAVADNFLVTLASDVDQIRS